MDVEIATSQSDYEPVDERPYDSGQHLQPDGDKPLSAEAPAPPGCDLRERVDAMDAERLKQAKKSADEE